MTYIKKEIFAVLHDITKKPISEKEKYYEMLKFIHKKANDKEIEFNKDLQAQFDVDYKIIKFDHTYFENGEYKPLYVCLAALADREIYAWLGEAYNMTHNEEFSDEILKNQKLRFEKESGPLLMFTYDLSDDDEKALIYAKKNLYNKKG